MCVTPGTQQLGGAIHVAGLRPLRIEVHRLVGNPDVVAQRRHDRGVPQLVDIVGKSLAIHEAHSRTLLDVSKRRQCQPNSCNAFAVVVAASAVWLSPRASAMTCNTRVRYMGSLR